jgi:hypothetical protein
MVGEHLEEWVLQMELPLILESKEVANNELRGERDVRSCIKLLIRR